MFAQLNTSDSGIDTVIVRPWRLSLGIPFPLRIKRIDLSHTAAEPNRNDVLSAPWTRL